MKDKKEIIDTDYYNSNGDLAHVSSSCFGFRIGESVTTNSGKTGNVVGFGSWGEHFSEPNPKIDAVKIRLNNRGDVGRFILCKPENVKSNYC